MRASSRTSFVQTRSPLLGARLLFSGRAMLFCGCALLVCGFFSGCAMQAPQPVRTQLQIREFQTRNFTRPEKNNLVIIKAILNVLQDDGFIVRNADKDLGYVLASKETPVQNGWDTWLGVFAQGNEARYPVSTLTEASVNISDVGQEVKVRVVFQDKLIDNAGGSLRVRQIEDPVYYRDFFIKVDKGIFLERQKF